MKIKLIYLVIISLILVTPNASAICQENQININEASIEELDQIFGIGPVKAQAIVDARPFDSVDDLIKVNGIGEITLDKIKSQDLACVEEEKEKVSQDDNEDTDEIVEENNINPPNNSIINEVEEEIEISIINLTKDIKIEDSNENTGRTYAIYGFIVFCILLIFLFILRKNRFENEFD